MNRSIFLIFSGLFICFSALAQSNAAYYLGINSGVVTLYSIEPASGVLNTIGVVPGVSTVASGSSSINSVTREYYTRTNLGLTVIDLNTANVLDSFPASSTTSLLEYNMDDNTLYYVFWDGSQELFGSTNLTTRVQDTISVLPGITVITKGSSTFDDENNLYIFQSKDDIHVVDIITGAILFTYTPTTVSSFSKVEYDTTTQKLFYVSWNGTNELLCATDFTTGMHQIVGTMTGVLNVGSNSTLDRDRNHYILKTNLGLTSVDLVTGNVAFANSPPSTSIVNIEMLHCSSTNSLSVSSCLPYTSPSGIFTWDSTGTYLDTLSNSVGCDSVITVNLTISEIDTTVFQTGMVLTAVQSGANYQWLDCDSGMAVITGSTGASFTSLVGGRFAVVIEENGCSDTSGCHLLSVEKPDAVEQIGQQLDFEVFPNPSAGLVQIQFDKPDELEQIVVHNAYGQLITRKPVLGTNMTITLDEPDGTYILTIVSNNKSKRNVKLIIQR